MERIHMKNEVVLYILSFLFPFYILITPYSFGGINANYYIFLPLILIAIITNRYLKVDKGIMRFLIYSIVIQLIGLLGNSYSNPITIFIAIIFSIITTFMVFGLSSFIKVDYMMKVYSFLAIVCIAVIFYQSFRIYVQGIPTEPILLFRQFHERNGLIFDTSRPASFFNEPQHFSSFIIPLLYWKLKEDKILYSVIISISIMLSGSSQGIILCIFTWTYFMFYKKDKYFKFIVIFMSLGAIIAFLNLNIFNEALFKITSIDIRNNVRTARGFGIFLCLPGVSKLLGIGNIPINEYILKTGYAQQWYRDPSIYRDAYDFISSYSATFLWYGIIGGILFTFMFLNWRKNVKDIDRCMVYIVFISSLSQSLLFNSWYVFYFVMILLVQRGDKGGLVGAKKQSYAN